MILSLAGWAVIPFAPGWVVSDINVEYHVSVCSIISWSIRNNNGGLGE